MTSFYLEDWLVEPALNRLTGRTATVSVEPRVMRLLVCLAEQAGTVVHREALLETVWGDTIVTEQSLTNAISDLRKIFQDDPQNPGFIETIRGAGYRLLMTPQTASLTTPAPFMPLRQRRSWIGALVGLVAIVLLAYAMWPAPSLPQLDQIRPLTTRPGMEINPAFSPDGQHVAFAWFSGPRQPSDIYVKPIHGGTAVPLTNSPGVELEPTWSPDGSQIAFKRYNGQGCGLYIVAVLGGTPRKLMDSSCSLQGLTWSPRDTQLAYTDTDSVSGTSRVYLLDIQTLATTPLTTPTVADVGDTGPRFSPDGQTVLFLRWRARNAADLYQIAVDGAGNSQRLTTSAQNILGYDWTPETRQIWMLTRTAGVNTLSQINPHTQAMTPVQSMGSDDLATLMLAREGDIGIYNNWLYAINIWQKSLGDTGAAQQVITSTRSDVLPQFSPDGSRIAFVSNRTGVNEIWISAADGSTPFKLTDLKQDATTRPQWSPDGRDLLFTSRVADHNVLFRVDAEGGVPQQMTEATTNAVRPTWSLDGQWVYFGSDRTGAWQLWRQSTTTTTHVQQITTTGALQGYDLPNGDLLILKPRIAGIWQLNPSTGEETHLLTTPIINWQRGKGGMYYTQQPKVGADYVLYHWAFGATSPEQQTTFPNQANAPFVRWGFTVSPDEQTLLYAQVDQQESDLILFEYR